MARGRGKGGQEGQEAGTGAEQGERRQEELSHCWTLAVNSQSVRKERWGVRQGGREGGGTGFSQTITINR